jgi:hypothetical protein
MLEVRGLEEFLRKCEGMLRKHPRELKTFMQVLNHLVHATLYVGYLRGKQGPGNFEPEEVFKELFNKFLTEEWRKLNDREDFYLDEDFFLVVHRETLNLAEELYPLVKKLMATEPIKGPIGRVVFKVEEEEEKGGKDEG